MWELIAGLPGLISGAFGTLNHLTDAIANEKINARNADTEDEKTRANERVKTLEARRDLMIAESHVSKANIYVRAGMAGAVVILLWKLLVWDKVIGSLVGCSMAAKGTCLVFTTDPLDENQWKFVFIVAGFYFLYEAVNAYRK